MEYSDRVVILRVGKFRETDLWVRFLSPSRGILSAFAFGGTRSRRRFTGCLDLFNDVLLQLKSTRGGQYLALQEGVLMKGPARLRRDWRRLGLAMNCLKFLEAFGVGQDGAGAAHTLFCGTLTLLEESERLPEQLPFWFRARLAFEQGYALDCVHCASCGAILSEQAHCFFAVTDARFYCPCCAPRHTGGTFFLRRETLDALAYVQENPPSLWPAGPPACLGFAERKESVRMIDAFIQRHVGLSWSSNKFSRV
jgi:DNA repair protein RecO (recombination protein O)